MTPRLKTLGALALGLLVSGWAVRDAAAGAMPYSYSTLGSVDTPAGGFPSLIYYNGVNNGSVTPPGNVDLGQFVMSSLAATNNETFTNTPFHLVIYTGANGSELATGNLNGSVGPAATNPGVTATFTSLTPLGSATLPFNLSLPLNTPLNLALATASAPAPTSLTGATSTVPEPSSVAVFAVALGGLGLWRRRAAR